MDFWAGTFGPPLLAFFEVILMMWIFGGDRLWAEMHRGAVIKAPRPFYYTAKYITPLFLGIILMTWTYQNIILPVLTGTLTQTGIEGVEPGWAIWVTRAFLAAVLAGMCLMIYAVWKRKAVEA